MDTRSNSDLVSQIAEKIHFKISSGEIAPGQRLRQEALAEEFQVSRTPVREALSQLEARGIISQNGRQSAIVRSPSARDVREMYQIRAEMEGLAAELAARWITDEQLHRLAVLHERFDLAVHDLTARRAALRTSKPASRTGSDKAFKTVLETWIRTNKEFHETIHDASRNAQLRRLITELNMGYIKTVMTSSARGMDSRRMEQTIEHHQAILYALNNHDAAQARERTKQHILESGEYAVAWFEQQSSDAL